MYKLLLLNLLLILLLFLIIPSIFFLSSPWLLFNKLSKLLYFLNRFSLCLKNTICTSSNVFLVWVLNASISLHCFTSKFLSSFCIFLSFSFFQSSFSFFSVSSFVVFSWSAWPYLPCLINLLYIFIELSKSLLGLNVFIIVVSRSYLCFSISLECFSIICFSFSSNLLRVA